jgi:hypothetical protein
MAGALFRPFSGAVFAPEFAAKARSTPDLPGRRYAFAAIYPQRAAVA